MFNRRKMKKIQIINKIKFYNPTMELAKIYYDNKHYFINPQSSIEVPADGAELVYNEWAHAGVFPVLDGDDFEKVKREALIIYIRENLTVRIDRWNMAMSERKKVGMVYQEEPHALTELKQWKTELLQILEEEEPVIEIPSFLEARKAKAKADEEKLTMRRSANRTKKENVETQTVAGG